MSVHSPSWEPKLMKWALEAVEHNPAHEPSHMEDVFYPLAENLRLAEAYAHCSRITHQNSRTFYLASALLPAEKRRAVRALYAFCRVTDDLVDHGDGNAEANLQTWAEAALARAPNRNNLVLAAWADTCRKFHIPGCYARQLIEGVGRDLAQARYETFDELATYCYGVASTVGLMAMHITGFAGLEAIPYAVKLGVALQVTNLLRDVGEDWQLGRLYLPLRELARFGLSEADVAAGEVSREWQAFMQFQIARARQLYAESLPGIQLLAPDGRFAIASAALLYQGILADIEEHGYDVFHRRAHLTGLEKIGRLPRIWLLQKNLQPPAGLGQAQEENSLQI